MRCIEGISGGTAIYVYGKRPINLFAIREAEGSFHELFYFYFVRLAVLICHKYSSQHDLTCFIIGEPVRVGFDQR